MNKKEAKQITNQKLTHSQLKTLILHPEIRIIHYEKIRRIQKAS